MHYTEELPARDMGEAV